MSTQQDIYEASSESPPPMLNRENYVPWSSRLLWYAKSRPNGKLIHNSILNGPYVRKMIPEPGDANREITEIWLRGQQMMKGSDIGILEKKVKLFNEWERQITQPGINMGQDRQMQMVGGNGGNQFRQYAGQNAGNLAGYNDVIRNQVIQNAVQNPRVQNVGNQNGLIGVQGNRNQNQIENGNLVAARAEGNVAGQNGNQIRCYNCRGMGHYARNYTVRPRRRDAAYLQTQLLIAQKEEAGIQLQVEEYDLMAESQLTIEVEKVNSVNRTLKETNADLTTELARFKNQTRCFEISQEKYDKLKRCYQQSVYQEQCLFKKINALHLSTGKQIMTLNEQISELNKQLSKEKSTVSFLLEEKKKLKSDFKTYEDELLDKQIQLEKKIKELNNILHKTGQSIQMIHMLSLKPDSFYHSEQKMALGYQNSFYLKHAQKKQQSLYDGKMLLEKHDPPVVHDLEETLKLAQAIKFVGDFKSLANEANASFAKHKALELEIKRLLKAVVNQDIMIIVQNKSVVDTSDLQTELERTKERFENCIIKKETEYAKLWNDWYKKCDECKYDKISYDKAYKDIEQKIKRLQAQLGDLKGKSKDTSCVSDTRNLLSQKLENENVELEFQVLNYARENAHLKATNKNMFDSISVLRTQTKTIIASLQNELQSTIYKNAKLRTQLFKKVSDQKDDTQDTSENTKFAKQLIVENLSKVSETNALLKPVTSNSVSTTQESKGVNKDKVIAPVMFRINPFKTSREEKHVPNTVSASARTKPIIVSQPTVITKKDVNYDPKVTKPKKVGTRESLATPKPRKSRLLLRCSPTSRLFDQEGNIVDSSAPVSQSDCINGDNACTSNSLEPKIKSIRVVPSI
nr:hypothetical protein [Tanacetum cinerariifolium]